MRTRKELGEALQNVELYAVGMSSEGRLDENHRILTCTARAVLEWCLSHSTERAAEFAEMIDFSTLHPTRLQELKELREYAIREGVIT